VVRHILKQLKVIKPEVELGRISFLTACESILPVLERKLNELDLSIIRNKDEILMESIRLGVKKYIDTLEHKEQIKKFPEFLQKRLVKNYTNLSRFFKENEEITLEAYIILQKAERVKRLICENELSLKEIAERLHYASLQHLSAQFRRVTGFTITEFKKRTCSLHSYESITSVLTDLKLRGFKNHFDISGKNLTRNEPSRQFSLKDMTLKEIYRFDVRPSHFGKSIIFEAESNDGAKGYLICYS
jgi:AraC-like DNA-binding protein